VKQFSKFIGMDIHKATITVCVADAGGGKGRYVGEIADTPEAIEKPVRQLRRGGAHLSFCYGAGPCGYVIHRQLSDLGWDVQVAPSLIPRKAGERLKTDHRDSLMLAMPASNRRTGRAGPGQAYVRSE
jgi:transposase